MTIEKSTHPIRDFAAKGTDLLSAMANQNRLIILCQLVDGERSVKELAEMTGVRQPTVSQHLALLRNDHLVKSRSEGRTRFYSLEGPEARRVIETLYKLYSSPGYPLRGTDT